MNLLDDPVLFRQRYCKQADNLLLLLLLCFFRTMIPDAEENVNIAEEPGNKALVESLSSKLKKGWKDVIPTPVGIHKVQ